MFNHEPEKYDCPFCNFVAGKETELNSKADVIYEDSKILAFVAPKWWVNNPGNVIVIPKLHVENIYDIEDELLGEIQIVGKQVALAMKKGYMCDGVSFRQHNEPDGSQDVWHFHLHVFPRWKDDELYERHKDKRMVPAEERSTYAEKLRPYFTK